MELVERWVGRLGGGGTGADCRMLSARECVDSTDPRRWGSGTWAGEPPTPLRPSPSLFLLGGGAGVTLFAIPCTSYPETAGLGGSDPSGTLPAASRSNTDSASSSSGLLNGAGGSGLLKSDGVLVRGGVGGAGCCRALSSPPSWRRMAFPWRELGGGGFFLGPAAGSLARMRGAASGSGLRVLGGSDGAGLALGLWRASTGERPAGSNEESDSVSRSGGVCVEMVPSDGEPPVGLSAPAWPVRRRRLKAATSNDALPGVRADVLFSFKFLPGSISCSVLLNGFRRGGPDSAGVSTGPSTWEPSNGSWEPHLLSIGDCAPTGPSDSESDDRGGGVWTRTRFTTFFRFGGSGSAASAGVPPAEALFEKGSPMKVAECVGEVGFGLNAAAFPFRLKGFELWNSADMVARLNRTLCWGDAFSEYRTRGSYAKAMAQLANRWRKSEEQIIARERQETGALRRETRAGIKGSKW